MFNLIIIINLLLLICVVNSYSSYELLNTCYEISINLNLLVFLLYNQITFYFLFIILFYNIYYFKFNVFNILTLYNKFIKLHTIISLKEY